MLTQINERIQKAARVMAMKHPNAVDVTVFRKVVTREAETKEQGNDTESFDDDLLTIGGAGVMSIRDDADFEPELLGAGRMLFLDRAVAADHAAFENLGYAPETTAYIEPLIDGEFEIKKQDRVFWHLAENVVEYEVKGIQSPSLFPDNRLNVYILQPIEVGYSIDDSN